MSNNDKKATSDPVCAATMGEISRGGHPNPDQKSGSGLRDHLEALGLSGSGLEDGLDASGLSGSGWYFDPDSRDQKSG